MVYQHKLACNKAFRDRDSMTPVILSPFVAAAIRGLHRLVRYSTELLAGIEEARAMALRYQTLAALSDRELAARGLKRTDIPRAVLATFHA
jgi:hypothetical protein